MNVRRSPGRPKPDPYRLHLIRPGQKLIKRGGAQQAAGIADDRAPEEIIGYDQTGLPR
jgi:hypothetical protein